MWKRTRRGRLEDSKPRSDVAGLWDMMWQGSEGQGKDMILTPWDSLAFIGGCDNSVKHATLWGTKWRADQWEELLHGPENESARAWMRIVE